MTVQRKISDTLAAQLLEQARIAQKGAYADYSHFRVGCALLTKSGKIYTGANAETYSNENGICAERNAIFKAITAGEAFDDKDFIDVMGITCNSVDKTRPENISPCGPCRQVTKEFAQENTLFIADNETAHGYLMSMMELLPHGFRLFDDENQKGIKPDFEKVMHSIQNTQNSDIIFNALEQLSQNSYVPANFHPESCVVVSSSGQYYAGVRVINSCTNLSVSAFKVAINQFAIAEKIQDPNAAVEKIYLYENNSVRKNTDVSQYLPADLLSEFGAKEIAVHIKANGTLSEFIIN